MREPSEGAPLLCAARHLSADREVLFHGVEGGLLGRGEFDFIEGQDPSFLATHDPKRWELIEGVRRGEIRGAEIAALTGYRWIFAPRSSALAHAAHAGGWSEVYRDERWVVLEDKGRAGEETRAGRNP